MKTDIILAGVGGQGILTIAAAMGLSAMRLNLHIKQSEVHGMSQRGGAVQSHLRISNKPISSDLIPIGTADIVLSVEPMESLRYLSYLNEDGWLITNSKPYVNIPDYPDLEKIFDHIRTLPHQLILDAEKMATEGGFPRSSNIVMLGAAITFQCCLNDRAIEESLGELFGRKGKEVVDANIKAYHAGKDYALKNTSR
jgi:indolepyruvate ferredoxin oxidoreductase, beta subunit